jgi:hypothetical protein
MTARHEPEAIKQQIYVSRFNVGSFAIILRYMPTPESSDGAGEESLVVLEPELFAVRVATVVLPCEVLRVLLIGVAVPRVLSFHAGLVVVALTILE